MTRRARFSSCARLPERVGVLEMAKHIRPRTHPELAEAGQKHGSIANTLHARVHPHHACVDCCVPVGVERLVGRPGADRRPIGDEERDPLCLHDKGARRNRPGGSATWRTVEGRVKHRL